MSFCTSGGGPAPSGKVGKSGLRLSAPSGPAIKGCDCVSTSLRQRHQKQGRAQRRQRRPRLPMPALSSSKAGGRGSAPHDDAKGEDVGRRRRALVVHHLQEEKEPTVRFRGAFSCSEEACARRRTLPSPLAPRRRECRLQSPRRALPGRPGGWTGQSPAWTGRWASSAGATLRSCEGTAHTQGGGSSRPVRPGTHRQLDHHVGLVLVAL